MSDIHYNNEQHQNNHFFCGVDKMPGLGMSTNIDHVTCLYCLRLLITDKRDSEKYPAAKRCGDCEHLTMTEEKQLEFFDIHGEKPEHLCKRYGQQVFHFDRETPYLMRCGKCMRENGFTPKLQPVR
jgi:hypothetical protein